MQLHFNPRPKAADVFLVAEQFRNASKLITLIHSGRLVLPFELDMPIVSPVCSALALELYFKCLIRIGRKPVDMKHDLVPLFRMIGRRHQAEIRRFFNANCAVTREYLERKYQASGEAMPKFGFDFCLNASRNAFTRMRYVYENGLEPNSGWLCDMIMEGARKAILDKFPNWEDARQLSPRGEPGLESTPHAP